MKGDLKMKTSTGGGIMKRLGRIFLSKETFFINEIVGKGGVYFKHLKAMDLSGLLRRKVFMKN